MLDYGFVTNPLSDVDWQLTFIFFLTNLILSIIYALKDTSAISILTQVHKKMR